MSLSYEIHRLQLESGAKIEAVRQGHSITLGLTGPDGVAAIKLSGHELLRVAKALEVIAMGVVTER